MQFIRTFVTLAALASTSTVPAIDIETLVAKRKTDIDGELGRIVEAPQELQKALADAQQQYRQVSNARSAALRNAPELEDETEVVEDKRGKKTIETDEDAVKRNRAKRTVINSIAAPFNQQLATIQEKFQRDRLELQQYPYRRELKWELIVDRFGRSTIAEQTAAIDITSKWTVESPKNPYALVTRALAEIRLGKTALALTDLTDAIAVSTPAKKMPTPPVHIMALCARAHLQLVQGKKSASDKDFARAFAVDDKKNDLNYYLYRAHAEYRQGKFLDSEQKLVKAATLYPDDPETHRLLALLYAACPQNARRNGDKALVCAERACSLTGHACWACLYSLAAAQAEGRNYEKAVKTASLAADLTVNEHRDECLRCQRLYAMEQSLQLDWK